MFYKCLNCNHYFLFPKKVNSKGVDPLKWDKDIIEVCPKCRNKNYEEQRQEEIEQKVRKSKNLLNVLDYTTILKILNEENENADN